MASRRPHAGADRRIHHPRGRHAENGNVRHPPILPAAVSRGGPLLRSVHLCSGGHRHHLRRAGGHGATGHEAPRRVFQRQPPGLHRARPVLGHERGRAGRGDTDGQPRHQHGRAFHARGYAVRSPAHAPDIGVRRHRQAHARLRCGVPHHHLLVDRAAWHERIRRRVPDPRWHVQHRGSCYIRRFRRLWSHPRSRVYAVDGPTRVLRADQARREREVAGSVGERTGRCRAPRVGGILRRRVPEVLPRPDGR